MKTRIRIVYVHHASELGGSSMSLYYLVKGLDNNEFEPIVVLLYPSDALKKLYVNAGARVVDGSGISTFEHTTAKYFNLLNPFKLIEFCFHVLKGILSIQRTKNLIAKLQPNIVHLNSVVLLWSAYGLKDGDIPFIWHVREHPVKGLTGLRRYFIQQAITCFPTQSIFLTKSAKKEWIKNSPNGIVISNYINFSDYDFQADHSHLRQTLKIEDRFPVLLYTGGVMKIKGIFVLLEALNIIKNKYEKIVCIMPGSVYVAHDKGWKFLFKVEIKKILSFVGIYSITDKFLRSIEKYNLRSICITMPFQTLMAQFYNISDIVLFPSIEPHFARPIIEAGAMKKPVIVSDVEGIEEQVVNGENGVIFKTGDAESLAQAIMDLAKNSAKMKSMGENGYKMSANNHSSEIQQRLFTDLYKSLFHEKNGNS